MKKEDQTLINIRVLKTDKAALVAKAEAANMTLTAYMVRTGLGRQINHGNSADIINELRVLGEQQRELARSDRRNEHQYQRLLDMIVETLLTIPKRIATSPSRVSPWAPGHSLRAAPCKPFK